MRQKKTRNNVKYNVLHKDFVKKFKKYGHLSAHGEGGRAVGDATRQKKRAGIVCILNTLVVDLGYKLQKIECLKQKHIKALVHYWEDKGLAPKTINDKMTFLRTMADWVGKRSMVKNASFYAKNPDALIVKSVPTKAKDWSTQGIDPIDKINEVLRYNVNYGLVLVPMLFFGMRIQEAILFHPHEDVAGDIVTIVRGTKGSKLRTLKIKNDQQRAVIKMLRHYISPGCNFISPRLKYNSRDPKRHTNKSRSYNAFSKACYGCFNRHGISMDDGIVPHGLRHEFVLNSFKEISGFDSPLREASKPTKLTREVNKSTREQISREIGHNRDSITSAYAGSSPYIPKSKVRNLFDEEPPQFEK